MKKEEIDITYISFIITMLIVGFCIIREIIFFILKYIKDI